MCTTRRWTKKGNLVCEDCDLGGDLLACDFCNLAWCNMLKCLRGSPCAKSTEEDELWACPTCWRIATDRYKKNQERQARGAGKKRRRRR